MKHLQEPGISRLWYKFIRSTDTSAVHNELEQLLKFSSGPMRIVNPSTVNELKCLAQVHGLPRSFCQGILEKYRDSPTNAAFRLELVYIIKHCTAQDSAFISLADLLDLLFSYSSPEEDGNCGREVVIQLLFTIASLLNPVRVKLEGIDHSVLLQISNYLPAVANEEAYESIRSALERVCFPSDFRSDLTPANSFFKSGGSTTASEGYRGSGSSSADEEVVVSIHAKKYIDLQSTKIQRNNSEQLEPARNEGYVSQKREIPRANLFNALWQSRSKFTPPTARHNGKPKVSKTGSELCWYKTTSQEIDDFLRMAQSHEVISKEGIEFLTRKLSGFKLSLKHKIRTMMITKVAQIFSLIAEYQKLSGLTVRELFEVAMNPDYKEGSYESAKEYLLKAIENYCEGGGGIDPEIQIRLSRFKDSPSCTAQMSKSIWRILSNYDDYLASSFEEALGMIEHCGDDLDETLAALDYMGRQVAMEKRAQKLACYDYVSPLIDIIVNGRNLYPFSYEAQFMAVDIIEDYVMYNWANDLHWDSHLKNLVLLSLDQDEYNLELKSKAVRCVLYALERNQNNPQYFRSIEDSAPGDVKLLFQSLFSVRDKKLEIIVIATVENLVSNPEIRAFITSFIEPNFLRGSLARNDIIYYKTGQIILEENLPANFRIDETEYEGGGNFICVSAITAKILLVVSDRLPDAYDDSTASVAAYALATSLDKQTRIYCAEYLFNVATSGKPFTLPLLNGLQACALDSVPDVHVYATAAYCVFMAHPNLIPPMAHLNYLPNVYTFKRLLLDDQDFTKYVNPNILDTLCKASKHTAMAPQTLNLLTLILNDVSVDNNSSEEGCFTIKTILEILENFCNPEEGEVLPEATVSAVC